MLHSNQQLNPTQVRRRLIVCKPGIESQPGNDSSTSTFPNSKFLLGLFAGESLLFDKSLKLKVIKGSVEIGGHLYPVMDKYRKFLVPSWSPSERLMALCYNISPVTNKLPCFSEETKDCEECRKIFNYLNGGSCCEFVSKYKNQKRELMGILGLEDPGVPVIDPKYHEFVSYYEENMDQEFDTILILSEYSSCFGTVSVQDSLEAVNPPKIIPNRLTDICSQLLKMCFSGPNPVIMVRGDRQVGKSTIIAYIINYLLNFISSVCLLDIDVGQPVASVPGLISLTFFEESITVSNHSLIRETKPKLSVLTGDIKVNNSLLFLRLVKRCFDVYERGQGKIRVPLLINSYGWITGIGAKIVDAVGSLTKSEIVINLINPQKSFHAVNIADHDDLKYHIGNIENMDMRQFLSEDLPYEVDTFPLLAQVVEELGGHLPWEKKNDDLLIPSFHIFLSILKSCNNFDHFDNRYCNVELKKDMITPQDKRWLRFCSYLNNGFADALHFPTLRHEEFFGSVETNNFLENVKFTNKFHPPKQVELKADQFMFVTQSDILPKTHSELVPMISGSIVGLCKGKVNAAFKARMSDQWNFLAYAYVHYLDPKDLSILVSYPNYKSAREIRSANIIVMCLNYRFDPCPGKIPVLNSYPSNNTTRLEEFPTQIYPFRRNELLHMVGAYGAGTSAPSQRSNLKRAKAEYTNPV